MEKISNYEKIKSMSVDELAEFLRWDILDRLPCNRSCEGSPDCQFACLKMMKLWLGSAAE